MKYSLNPIRLYSNNQNNNKKKKYNFLPIISNQKTYINKIPLPKRLSPF